MKLAKAQSKPMQTHGQSTMKKGRKSIVELWLVGVAEAKWMLHIFPTV
jgi:hypothetical protein